VKPGSDHDESPRDDGHDGYGKDLLADTVWGFAMKFLDLENDLLVSVMFLNPPSPEIEIDDVLPGKAALVQEIGEKYRDLSIGTDQSDHPQLNTLGFFPLPWAESLKELVGGGDHDVVFLSTVADKGFHGGECRFGRTTKQEISLVVLSQEADEIIARISAIEKQHGPGRDEGQEGLGLLSFRSMNTDHTPGQSKTPEHIVGRCNQTLRIMPFAFMLEATLRVEFFSNLFCRR